jgi:hypothetical protein
VNGPWTVPNSRQEQAQPAIWSAKPRGKREKASASGGNWYWGDQSRKIVKFGFGEVEGEEDGKEEERRARRRQGRGKVSCRLPRHEQQNCCLLQYWGEEKREPVWRGEKMARPRVLEVVVIQQSFNSRPRWVVLGWPAKIGEEGNKIYLHAECKTIAAGCDEHTKGAGKVGQHAEQQFTHHGGSWQRIGD